MNYNGNYGNYGRPAPEAIFFNNLLILLSIVLAGGLAWFLFGKIVFGAFLGVLFVLTIFRIVAKSFGDVHRNAVETTANVYIASSKAIAAAYGAQMRDNRRGESLAQAAIKALSGNNNQNVFAPPPQQTTITPPPAVPPHASQARAGEVAVFETAHFWEAEEWQ
jgi:hypothetical protein